MYGDMLCTVSEIDAREFEKRFTKRKTAGLQRLSDVLTRYANDNLLVRLTVGCFHFTNTNRDVITNM
jgi:hypothetical protein